MDIELANERLFLLHERLSFPEMQQLAMDRRVSALSSGISGLFQRPKPEDIVLVGSERRLDPFWHVSGRTRYVYERKREYPVPVTSDEVQDVTFGAITTVVTQHGKGRQFLLSVTEHCVDELTNELFINGVSGSPFNDGAAVAAGPRDDVSDPATLAAEQTIVVPPEHRSSFAVRTLISGMTKVVDADVVNEEQVVLEHIDLYYRPVRAFEFFWTSKDRRGVVEIDAITGQVNVGRSLSADLSKLLTRDTLFDIGADTAGLLIPGGSIVVKVAKIAFDQASKPTN